MMPGLVPDDQLAASQALQSIYWDVGCDRRARRSAALLIAAVGVGWTYVIDAADVRRVARSPSCWSRRRRRKVEVASEALESLREGWRFLVRQPVILGTFVLDTNAMVFGMPQALFPAIAAHHFDAGAGSSACSTRRRRRVRCSPR